MIFPTCHKVLIISDSNTPHSVIMATEEGVPVDLYIYDLTHGLASVLSPAIIGQQIEGVWHTSIVVYEREYFYGGAGVTTCAPGSTQLGAPHEVERLGTTFVPFSVFNEYIQGLATTTYTGAAYRLLEHNCNHFSAELAQFACGARVPERVLAQPAALPAALRAALSAALGALQPDGAQVLANGVRRSRRDSPDFVTLNSQIEEARAASAELEARRHSLAEKLARKQRRRDKRRRRRAHGDDALLSEDEMAEAVEAAGAGPSARAADADAEAERRPRDPPILFTDVDGAAEFEAFAKELEGVELSEEEKQSMEELRQYLVQGEGSWVLGEGVLALTGRVLNEGLGGDGARARALGWLAAAALRDDVALLLHQDRRAHGLLAYAARADEARGAPELAALARFLANLFAHAAPAEWLLYVSEWESGGRVLSNMRASTKACVHAVLGADPALRDAGTALLYNIATKERLGLCATLRHPLKTGTKFKVFDEVCVELCMAALQLVAWAPPEEPLWRALAALARLVHHSHDVPQLVAMVGPDPATFRGTSPRVDEQIDIIMQKVASVAS